MASENVPFCEIHNGGDRCSVEIVQDGALRRVQDIRVQAPLASTVTVTGNGQSREYVGTGAMTSLSLGLTIDMDATMSFDVVWRGVTVSRVTN